MPLTTNEHGTPGTSTGGEKCPRGRWRGVCLSVEPGDDREATYDGKTKRTRRVVFVFEVTAGASGDRFEVKRTYNWTMFKDSANGRISDLRRDLEAWRDTPFENQEAADAFDLETCTNREATVQIDHNAEWVNITGLAPKGRAEVQTAEPDTWD